MFFLNDACDRTYDGYLVAEFVFLMFFALADTLHLWLMNGIDLFPTVTPLGKNGFKESEQFVIIVILLTNLPAIVRKRLSALRAFSLFLG